jgi:hypothetical protein
VPDTHDVADAEPETLTKLPAGAERHAACPVSGWYVPIGHGVSTVAPDTLTKEPASASWQSDCPVGWYCPIGHGVVKVPTGTHAVAAYVVDVMPAGHADSSALPVPAAKKPWSAGVHATLPGSDE